MNANEVLELVEIIKTGVIQITHWLKEESKDLPLDVRWDIFEKVDYLLPDRGVYFRLPDRFYYDDDLYCDKHQSISYSTIIEVLSDEDETDEPLTPEEIIEMKEEMISSGFGGCVNDW